MWEYVGNKSLVEFHVRWVGDEHDLTRQINKTFDGTDERVYLYEYEFPNATSFDPHGFTFNKEVCAMVDSACSEISTSDNSCCEFLCVHCNSFLILLL